MLRTGWHCLMAVLLLALCFDAPAASPPLRWRWSNPEPHGANIFNMAYGLGVTVEVGERGQIYTSDDLDLWAYRDSGTTNSLLGVAFLGNRMVVTGQNG